MGKQHYRQSLSHNAGMLATFREQMADFARAERLRGLRAEAHLSQEGAAHEIGVSVKAYRAWEQGGKIKWDNAVKVGAFYGVDPETLVSREPPTAAPDGDQPAEVEEPGRLDRIEAKVDLLIAKLLQPSDSDLQRAADELGLGEEFAHWMEQGRERELRATRAARARQARASKTRKAG